MSKISLVNPLIQSPYTYLQAAGSDGSDRTVTGVHLRWDFQKLLGENHLAKGDYANKPPYASGEGFNKENDFIGIYRTPFNNKYFVKIDFSVNQTTEIITGNSRSWKYTLPIDSLKGTKTVVIVRFIDYMQYDTLRAAQTQLNTIDLLNRFTGIVEVEPESKLFFYAEFDVNFKRFINIDDSDKKKNQDEILTTDISIELPDGIIPELSKADGYLRTESVTVPDTSDYTQKQVSCRKKFIKSNPLPTISCENIQYLRFDYKQANWKEIRIYCYHDFIQGTNTFSKEGDWMPVGDFSLTIDDQIAFSRFKPTEVDGPGGHWPKFNDANSPAGEFVVNKNNYLSRWRKPGFNFNPNNSSDNDLNGLQYFVHKYMEISVGDGKGLASLSSDTPGDLSTQDISYLEMLRLMSLDFHVARILGLGHIDDYGELQAIPHIYCLQYKTISGIDDTHDTAIDRTHIFMTPPVSTKEYRLPVAPTLTQPTFGISVDNGTSTPTMLTDPMGYAPFGQVRFININRGPLNFEKAFGPFYYDPTEFCLCDETQPIAYGLEYKEISELEFRKPEISHDSEYLDASGLPETVPLLESGTPKIFTHQEIEEGKHQYWAYAINWFSRISPLSNRVDVETKFPKQSHLLPPFNFAVQLIQDEDPSELSIPEKALILTTQAEQSMLAGMSATDEILVRATFDWNQVHHHAHQYADYAEIFFKRAEPIVVKGKVEGVTLLPNNRARVTIMSYEISSVFPMPLMLSIISPEYAVKFEGSFFNSGGENYVIENVDATSSPIFTIKLIKQINALGPDANSNQLISLETFKAPDPDDLFYASENMGEPKNWDLKHSRKIYLEKFYSNAKVTLRYSPTRTAVFDIKSVSIASGNTRVDIVQPIKTTLSSGMSLEYSVRHEIISVGTNKFEIIGNYSSDFFNRRTFRVFGNNKNDGLYTVTSSSEIAGSTTIVTNEAIPDITNSVGLIEIVVSRSIAGFNKTTNSFILSGNQIAEINPAEIEYRSESDNSLSRYVMGGIYDAIRFIPLETKPPLNSTAPFFREETGFIQLLFQNYNLLPHPDPDVIWDKGTVRLLDLQGKLQTYPVVLIGNLTNISTTHLAIVIQDPGFILKKTVSTPTASNIYSFNMGIGLKANYHPAYKIYLAAENGLNPVNGVLLTSTEVNFEKKDILPNHLDPTEGHRQTLMAIRSYDVKKDLGSFLSNAVVLLAQKTHLPIKPDTPTGPFYATYPNFYGKSTYTFDTGVDTNNRLPYSVVFYRGSEDRILDVLYRKSTQKKIWEDLNNLADPKAKYDPRLWEILFSGDNSPNGPNVTNPPTPLPPVGFRTYKTTAGQFTWPVPDNDGGIGLLAGPEKDLEEAREGYVFPFDMDNHPQTVFKPFECDSSTGLPRFNLNSTPVVYGKSIPAKAILKKAIMSAFLPLNEQPPIYNHIKEGTQTSGIKPRTRDAFGNIIDPIQNDTLPMIKRYTNPQNGKTVLRFTDYTLDGASISLYFYRVLEMDDKFKFSEESLPVGPVLMVNAFPPNKPQIRKAITKLQDFITETPASVLFEINNYSENEKITKVEIYRAIDELDALSIRTMKMVKRIPWGTEIIDDFIDVGYPLFGETLFYRIIAIREIEDIKDALVASDFQSTSNTKIVKLPSLPSDVIRASIVDVVNPPAPRIYAENGLTTLTELKDVILKWKPTAYNGTYYLQKLNASGNWVQKYSVKVKDTDMQYPPLLNNAPDFANYPETQILPRVDDDNNPIYHRFRVQVENSSGLFNLQEFELTLAKGTSDLQEIESVLEFADANHLPLPVLKTTNIVTGASYPDTMTFTHRNNPLPAGHNNFQRIEITVTDELDHMRTDTRTINIPGGNVIFQDGDGGLGFNAANPNRIYAIKTKLYTDYTPAIGIPTSNGATQVFTINYLAGPCYDLRQVVKLIKITDGTHEYYPAITSNIKNGVAYPSQLKIEKGPDFLALGQNLIQMIITVNDGPLHSAMKIIDANNPSVIFNASDSIDVSHPNRTYEINVKVATQECPLGRDVTYRVFYSYTPCDDLTNLTGIAKIIDGFNTEKILTPTQSMPGFTHPNGQITIKELISGGLPSGHTFSKLDVLLKDDFGGSSNKTIQNAGASVTFIDGEGSLVLNANHPQRTYYLSLTLFTDLCLNGSNYTYKVKY